MRVNFNNFALSFEVFFVCNFFFKFRNCGTSDALFRVLIPLSGRLCLKKVEADLLLGIVDLRKGDSSGPFVLRLQCLHEGQLLYEEWDEP